ncbi:MAG: mandelate racemase/muconate lactonizing enzyme family protein [Kiloniellaceae bacterium]
MTLTRVTLYRLRLPLIAPYRLSYRTFEAFEPIVVEVSDDVGRTGWGEGHISPGSGAETPAAGWAFCCARGAGVVGRTPGEAKASIRARLEPSRVAATAMLVAIEMLEDNPLLHVAEDLRLPLVTPVNSLTPEDIPAEVERRLDDGFGTFKIKVGQDVEADLARVQAVQKAIAGRATMRLDANRAFDRADGRRFAAALDPAGIELFEQPCAAEDWEANAAVAKVSTVPLMLDEPICDIRDIERAATIDGVAFCKLKLKRFGGLDRLKAALDRARDLGLEPVLGDGLGSELGCWMEACVARSTIRNAGEFNGFLKPKTKLFVEPLIFEQGCLVLKAGYRPRIDATVLAAQAVGREAFTAPKRGARGAAE